MQLISSKGNKKQLEAYVLWTANIALQQQFMLIIFLELIMFAINYYLYDYCQFQENVQEIIGGQYK